MSWLWIHQICGKNRSFFRVLIDIEVEEFNRMTQKEMQHIGDFIILHYKVTQRRDSKFWQDCARMDIPDSLANKIELFRKLGKCFRENEELFSPVAWEQVMIGQGIIPEHHHPIVSALEADKLDNLMKSIKIIIDRNADALPSHADFITAIQR